MAISSTVTISFFSSQFVDAIMTLSFVSKEFVAGCGREGDFKLNTRYNWTGHPVLGFFGEITVGYFQYILMLSICIARMRCILSNTIQRLF